MRCLWQWRGLAILSVVYYGGVHQKLVPLN
jgi:hypothetical protein